VDPALIRANLAEIRRAGPVESIGETTEGVGGAAAPVFNRLGEVKVAVAVAAPSAVISSNSTLSSSCSTKALRKRTKAVRSGVGSDGEKPQTRRNDERSSIASASLMSERSYQTESSVALNNANGGQAGSPWPHSRCLPEHARSPLDQPGKLIQ
jgi:hypothetical protein